MQRTLASRNATTLTMAGILLGMMGAVAAIASAIFG